MRSRLMEYRRLFIVALQAVLIILAYIGSFILRLEYPLPTVAWETILLTCPIVLLIKLAAFAQFGLLRGWWRYAGLNDLLDITKASFASTVLIVPAISYGVEPVWFPRSVYAIDLFLTIMMLAGVRVVVRLYTESVQTYTLQKRTLVAGAGRAGTELVRQLHHNPDLGYLPVGFVDDDPTKKGVRIHGLKVLAPLSNLPEVVRKSMIERVLIAIPSATGRVVDKVVRACREADVEFKILQPISTRINGRPHNDAISRLRELRLEDLLKREPVQLDIQQITETIREKVVLITGAGGSIGSELCRQCARFGPRKLILFERSENDLFRICTELSHHFPDLNQVPVIGDIQDLTVLRDTFALHRPHFIFHAAAYKHVPMMEMNCFQAIANNVFGTWNVAQVARQFEAEDFVLISSDKAVNPTNVMGVTKRVAELIVLGLPPRKTRFVAVRFGNVLGSNGSVVPLFEDQIARGGPVLVTHPEAQRYFMTIPEATQLVLQAASMKRGGEILILKMGEQVRIVDLAADLIRIAGFEPGRDIKIVFTGLRPGEKISEELFLQQEGMMPTPHEKLCVINPGSVDYARVQKWIEELTTAVGAKNVHALITTLKRIVPEYSPSSELLALSEVDRLDVSLKYQRASTSASALGAA